MVDKLIFSEDGFKLPSLCHYYKKKTEEMTKEEKEEDRDLTDGEVMERDLIKVRKFFSNLSILHSFYNSDFQFRFSICIAYLLSSI